MAVGGQAVLRNVEGSQGTVAQEWDGTRSPTPKKQAGHPQRNAWQQDRARGRQPWETVQESGVEKPCFARWTRDFPADGLGGVKLPD